MISAGTFHVIATELTIGMFALAGVAFLLCAIQKATIERISCAVGPSWRNDSNSICHCKWS